MAGRWHDSRHTLITELAESGASDQTIMDIAGHVSKQMLKHYSHIRMEAKRAALESIVKKQPVESTCSNTRRQRRINRQPPLLLSILRESPYKSPYSGWKIGVIEVYTVALTH